MACPHCGAHLLQKQQRNLLICCGCGRVRLDLAAETPRKGLRRHAPLLLGGLLSLPLALGLAVLDGLRLNGSQSPAERTATATTGKARSREAAAAIPAEATLSALPQPRAAAQIP